LISPRFCRLPHHIPTNLTHPTPLPPPPQNQLFATAFNWITQLAGVAETAEFGGSALAYLAADAAMDGVSGAW
jgi:hypothetical protein